ncbi:unnamed protein product [Prunus armeniaca]
MLEENPRQWHEKLSETLWAYRTSKREATDMTPYALTYGHDAILPMEIAVQSIRIAQQYNLPAVARAYNKRVRNKSFEEREVVWKAILLLGTHVAGYGKWSPTWEGPFIVKQVIGLGAYRLQDQDGDIYAVPTNGKWLKKFYPTMWDSQVVQTDPGIEAEKDEIIV